jgi:ABC-type Fe3+-hydroxamate transport system substrate-binding protein
VPTWPPEVVSLDPRTLDDVLATIGTIGKHTGAHEQAGHLVAALRLSGVPVWAIDADGLVVRPGPRLVDGVEALASILHPGQVPATPAGRVRRIA